MADRAPEEIERFRQEVRDLEGRLADCDRLLDHYRGELARLAEAFHPARIRAWYWSSETRLTHYLPAEGNVRDSQGGSAREKLFDEEELLQSIHPDDRAGLARAWDRAYSEHLPYDIEYRLAGDQIRHNHEIATPDFDESGRYLGHFGTTQDITERKLAEQALAAARDTLEQRVKERTAELRNANVDLQTEIEERKLTERALQASEAKLQQRVIDVEAARRSLEKQGADLIRLTQDLRIARDEAEAANQTKTAFLAAMSHELRTPLNAVIGLSEMMSTETLGPIGSPMYREYADDINDAGQHLLSLINDILDLSKIESGAEELQEEELDVRETVESVLRLVRHRIGQGGLDFESRLPEALPPLLADERKLKQILVNLLSNAIKFTNPGGKVGLTAWCRAGSGYVFQVVDSGIGIALEDIPRALSRFGQVESGLDRRFEGTGLGLPLTKALVEMHGGSLDLQSEVGIGTTVTVRFPAERIVAAALGGVRVGQRSGTAG